MYKKTKIICTVGPSTDTPEVYEELIINGMDIARFNFSHGTHNEHEKRIKMIRAAITKTNKHVALLLDTKGPEMRLGKFKSKKVYLKEGDIFTLTTREIIGTKKIVSINYKSLSEEVKPGNTILLDDGLISLVVDKIYGGDIKTIIQNSGEISDKKRITVPGVQINLPFLSEQDILDILFGINNKMDFIAASFVQQATDILTIRKVLENADYDINIIAKIENAAGVKNIDEIIKVADGVMVARGDLGVEIPPEKVPIVQKRLIEKCNNAGKPVIIATQMLESMIQNPRPTRAEASDVANAIFDGTDVIMLSAETASGRYPIEALKTMVKIANTIENELSYSEILLAKGLILQRTTTDAISHATVQIAHELNASAIITATETGYTARMVSKYRPNSIIVAVTPYQRVARKMLLYWGVYPILGNCSHNSDEMVSNSIVSVLTSGFIKNGDLIVITAGVPIGISGTTNMIRVHVVGNILLKGTGVNQKIAIGKICIVKSFSDLKDKFCPNDVLVIKNICNNTEINSYAIQASAIIIEECSLASCAAVVGINYGIPVIVGVNEATDRLHDQMIVTVDAFRGLIYQGEINVK